MAICFNKPIKTGTRLTKLRKLDRNTHTQRKKKKEVFIAASPAEWYGWLCFLKVAFMAFPPHFRNKHIKPIRKSLFVLLSRSERKGANTYGNVTHMRFAFNENCLFFFRVMKNTLVKLFRTLFFCFVSFYKPVGRLGTNVTFFFLVTRSEWQLGNSILVHSLCMKANFKFNSCV